MFNFLSNIASKARSTVSSFFQPTPPTPPPPTQTASRPAPQLNYTPAPQPMSVAPNMSTRAGPARANPNGTASFNTPKGAVTVPQSFLQNNPNPAIPGVNFSSAGARVPVTRQASTPITPPSSTPPPPQFGQSGGSFNTTMSASTPSVIPTRGSTGLMGTNGSGSLSLPSQTGASGASGGGLFSIGGSPLGVLNAGINASGSIEEEDAKKKKVQTVWDQMAQSGQPVGGFTPKGEVIPVPLTPTPTMSSRLVNKQIEKSLIAPTIPSTLDTSTLGKNVSGSSLYKDAPGSKSKDDLGDIQNNLKESLDVGIENALKLKGLNGDKDVVEDSPELQDFMDSLSGTDKFNYQTFADDFRTQNGMSDWLKLKESGIAAIKVMTKEYNEITKSIKANPDLPKGLKQRRIEMFKEQFDAVIGSAKEDIAMAGNAISDINGALNSQLGIVTAQRSENDRKRQMNLDVFKTLIDSGAEFTSAEKSAWATRLGLSAGALDSLTRKVAKKDYYIKTEDGVTTAIDKDTGATIWQNGTAKAEGGISRKDTLTMQNTIGDNASRDYYIKTFPMVSAAYGTVQKVYETAKTQKSGPSDLIFLRSLAKMTDPSTGVLSAEYETFEGAQGALAKLGLVFNGKLTDGTKLTTAARDAYLKGATDFYTSWQGDYDKAYDFYEQQAIRSGASPKTTIPYQAQTASTFDDAPDDEAKQIILGIAPPPTAPAEEGGWFSQKLKGVMDYINQR